MLRNKLVLLLLPFAIGGSSCSKNDTPVEDLKEYSLVNDFSNTQGYRGWKYLYGEIEEPKYMTYDIKECYWRGLDFYCYVQVDGQHPGNNNETIVAWDVQKSGKIQVDGTTIRCPDEWKGDGIYLYVAYSKQGKLQKDYLAEVYVGGQQKEASTFTFDISVKTGDTLYFVINGNKENSYDKTRSDFVITYK